MTEVRWFLSIQFSKSLVPWRAYQSRALGAWCQGLFGTLTGARLPSPHDMGSATIRKPRATVNPLRKVFFVVVTRLLKTETSPYEKVRENEGENKRKDGGRVPRQGRHVLDGTLDRMEGASLRGPETLPPWNLVFKWSDTGWYHSLGPGSFPPCILIMERQMPSHNPPSEGIYSLIRNHS